MGLSSLIVELYVRQWVYLSSLLGYVWDNRLCFPHCRAVRGEMCFVFHVIEVVCRVTGFVFLVIRVVHEAMDFLFLPLCQAISKITSFLFLPCWVVSGQRTCYFYLAVRLLERERAFFEKITFDCLSFHPKK